MKTFALALIASALMVGYVAAKGEKLASGKSFLPPIGSEPMPEPVPGRAVEVKEMTIVIPTYTMHDDEPYPWFDQWKRGTPVYPYPMQLSGTGKKVSREYKALVLENEYLKVVVLPELGGRIHKFYDKVNKRDIIYTNNVIKPGYFAVRGKWMSGGFEFNFPQAHATTTAEPIDYAIRKNPDGSASIWIGDVERQYRMRWQVKLTLFPGQAILRQDTKLENRTPFPHRYHWWTIVAMHPNDNTQVIFPTARVMNHPQHVVLAWPIWQGRDISRYKTLLHRFGWDWSVLDPWDGFFAYYDHGIDAGLVHTANMHVVGGSKYFSYHNTTSGRFHSAFVMSDEDGPYDEIDSSPFASQHDFRILEPNETHQFTEYWYAGYKLGGVAKATRDAVMNIRREQGKIKLALNVNRPVKGAVVTTKAGEKTVLQERCDLVPGVPYLREAKDEAGLLSVIILDSTGNKVLDFVEPQIDEGKLTPEGPYILRQTDANKLTAEGAYREGMFNLEHEKPDIAEDYFKKALEKDAGLISARNQLGIVYLKRALWEKAEAEFKESLKRQRYQGIPHYYLGLSAKLQDKLDNAKAHLWAAVKYRETSAAAHRLLGEIALAENKPSDARYHFEQALAMNAHATDIHGLLAVSLRLLKDYEGAREIVTQILHNEPLNHLAAYELYRLHQLGKAGKEGSGNFLELMRDNDYSYAELAWVYANCGLFMEAIAILDLINQRKQGKISPLLNYQMAYLFERLPQADRETEMAKKCLVRLKTLGAEQDWRYLFPNRIEDFAVLKTSLKREPDDYCAHYMLGNLLASRYRYDEAIEQFTRAASLAEEAMRAGKEVNPAILTVVYRNLAFLLHNVSKRTDEAIRYYREAIKYGGDHHRCYIELAQIYEGQKDTAQAIKILEWGLDKVVDPSDLVIQIALLASKLKDYDKIIELAPKYRDKYDCWKGLEIQRRLRDARLAKGKNLLLEKKYEEALAYLEQATKVCPENVLVMGQMVREFSEILWWRGYAYEQLGRLEDAKKAWAEAELEQHEPISPLSFYQAKCLQKLGKTEKATEILNQMLFYGKMYVEGYPRARDGGPLSDGMSDERVGAFIFLQALAHEGLGNIKEAEILYKQVAEHEWAKDRLQFEALFK